ncbi:MAG: TRAP transporter small permease subunit [Sphingomonadales bacterium]|nr:TRAP transporter small permease subunit [Sphingomonadales bacterium]
MRAALRLAEALSRVVTAIGRVAAWLAVAMMIVILTDVILRRYFVIGSTKLQELEWHLHGVLFLFCLGFAYVKGAHVRIELVRERLSAEARAWLELAGTLLFLLPYCAAILYFGFDYAEMAYRNQEVSASLTGLGARWAIKSTLVVGFALLGLAGVAAALKAAVFLFGPAELAGRTGYAAHESDKTVLGG